MRTQSLIIAIFMQLVAVIYTTVIYDNIIIPYHVEHMSIEWIWLSIPALLLTIGALWILIVHGTHRFSVKLPEMEHWEAKDMHVLDKHNLQ